MNFTPLTPDHFAHKHWQSHRDSRHLQNQHWTATPADMDLDSFFDGKDETLRFDSQ